ncbi:hypothetical protein Hypma_012551 [Hypsizygus marmoreus]|uniref:Uncharacterized protein n=1 Tax=Hypsizygus marmoreus TaxID=39966 RepID=A0A369JGH9_HYPMA|nr:hypothetical protein Hypma_012551 [Hypsizygus marmoreus]
MEVQVVELTDVATPLMERYNYEKHILSCFRRILSPVRRIHPEILAEIFLFTRDGTKDQSIPDFEPITVGPPPGPSPLRITHVCADWRRIALATSVLWTTITSSQTNYDPSLPVPDERLQTWLTRTGTYCPLDITVRGPRLSYTVRPAAPLTWLQPYIHRVRTLSLEGMLCQLPSGSFDALEMLKMDNCYLYPNANTNHTLPSLCRLFVEGDLYPPSYTPWQSLTHLYVDVCVIRPDMFLCVLSLSVVLVKLEVSIFEDVDAELAVADDKRIVMGQLQTFITHTGQATVWLLSHLTMPSLTTLRLVFDSWPGSIYNSFQSCSLFTLQSLRLRGGQRIDTADFFGLVRKMPSLRDISSFFALDITPTLISGFAMRSKSGIPDLAPNLEYMRLRSEDMSEVEDNAFTDMVTLRDPFGRPAFLQPNTSCGQRVFKSQEPKRSDYDIFQEFPSGEMVYIFF